MKLGGLRQGTPARTVLPSARVIPAKRPPHVDLQRKKRNNFVIVINEVTDVVKIPELNIVKVAKCDQI